MLEKTALNNVLIQVVGKENKENCAPFIVSNGRNQQSRKFHFSGKNRVLRDITHKFVQGRVSGVTEKLRI